MLAYPALIFLSAASYQQSQQHAAKLSRENIG
jgi:hypothetical protein